MGIKSLKSPNFLKTTKINSKGQAALMDSLFFLVIVSAVCTTLFFFTVNYGKQLDSQINSFYSTDFAADTIKVVSYINVLRTGMSVYDADGLVELDYLLAMMKEDYGNKKEFSCKTKKAIASTFNSVLKPFSDSLDYAFYFVNKSEDRFLFLMMAIHECSDDDPEACVCYDNFNDPACKNYVSGGNNPPKISLTHYYCTPNNIRILDQLVFPYVGKVDKATSKFDFLDSSGRSVVFDAELAMWVTKDVPVLRDLKENKDFNCVPINFEEPCP
ncbi:MAG: hypothetical protein GX950_03375 [Candidatus Diapherotrites archaeon]|uniref:Uncharacterized protein n=1 Tax=Candidatus Iainarchaeum sp. TaxID=3101447 RepID=A0A7K4C055_9ARCH|nr:hypothetical protein [Candidatus Diapherotrites archaeon]